MGKKNRNRQAIKTPKGSVDTEPSTMVKLNELFSIIRQVYINFGGEEIDTPVFELLSTLTSKYGEEAENEKLIYELKDQQGELLALRYDLTVPFARYMGERSNLRTMKRFQIGKVYRRDSPAIKSGRYREFWQCDFDIVGDYGDQRFPEANILAAMCSVLERLNLEFKIKLNNRKLLDGIMASCGVEEDKFRTICSAIDKMDKLEWKDVKAEMIEKGLTDECSNKIGEYVKKNGNAKEILTYLEENKELCNDEIVQSTLKEMKTLFDYLDAMNMLKYISFDLSLARGLDYYTGVIYEAVLIGNNISVGSVAAGGRYDGLIGQFRKNPLPAVGFSVGIQRILTVMQNRNNNEMKDNRIFIASESEDQTLERIKLCAEFREKNIAVETLFQDKPKRQWNKFEKSKCKYWLCIQNDGNIQYKTIPPTEDKIYTRNEIIDIMLQKFNMK